MNPIRILIADDHQLIIDGIKSILRGEKEMKVVAEAHNGREAINKLSEHKIEVALMDIQMNVMSGIEATALIKKQFPKVKVLALSMLADNSSISKMLHAGACGYILKNADKAELIRAIHQAVKGENYFSPEVTGTIMNHLQRKKPSGKPLTAATQVHLSEREKEIIKLLSEGHTNESIAEKLFLSPLTVKTHRQNIMLKLGVKNTAHLISFAVENGLIH